MNIQPPVILLAFANDKRETENGRFLHYLAREAEMTRNALFEAEKLGLCRVELVQNATLSSIESAFDRFRGQVAVFHFAGHSDNMDLLLEDWQRSTKKVDHAAFASYLVQQKSLKLVVFNSCISSNQLPAFRNSKIPALIYTNEYISDIKASDFALRFYRGISKGDSIQIAFQKARALAEAEISSDANLEMRAIKSLAPEEHLNLPTWDLYLRDGAYDAGEWDLASAADQRLRSLPPLPTDIGFPSYPYKQLGSYKRSDARIFWGRESELLQLYSLSVAESAQRIIVLSGSAGSGKSSILAAGLLPRLEGNFKVLQLKDLQKAVELQTKGGHGLQIDFNGSSEDEIVRAISENADEFPKPILLVIDQFETGMQSTPEFGAFIQKLSRVAELDYANGFQVKMIIATRNDYYSELEFVLAGVFSGFASVYLGPFSPRDIKKFIHGIASTSELRRQYNMSIEGELASRIIGDLGRNKDSLTTPILQLLLAHLYDQARKLGKEELELVEYEKLDLQMLLQSYINGRIEDTYILPEFKSLRNTGLVENVLGEFVSDLSKSRPRNENDICDIFPKKIREKVKPLVVHLKGEGRLLVDVMISDKKDEKLVGLIHDFLAPLVKHIQISSNLAGPRAVWILERISVDTEILSETVLEELEKGRPYAPLPNAVQEKVLKRSRKAVEIAKKRERDKKRGNRIRVALVCLVGLLLVVPGTGFLNAYGLGFLILVILLYRSG